MKRLGLYREDFIVCEIPKEEASKFIQTYHYSPVFPKLTKHWLGVYLDDKLVGAVTLGWGTQPKQTIKKLFPELDTQDYLEIGKMCMSEEMPRNSESQMLSKVVTWIRVHKPDVALLYTMADGIMGKVGYVYQASNFKYGGSYFTDVYMTSTGEKVHPRSTRELLVENAAFVGKDKLFWLTHDFLEYKGMQRIKGLMFRYMLPLNKKGKWILKKSDWSIDYPKDKDLVWKKQMGFGDYQVIERPTFSFDNIEVNKKNVNQYL